MYCFHFFVKYYRYSFIVNQKNRYANLEHSELKFCDITDIWLQTDSKKLQDSRVDSCRQTMFKERNIFKYIQLKTQLNVIVTDMYLCQMYKQ